ncbi:MAG: hypothetical protein O3C69_05920, partial [Chloroflexi bacterium]|nr:hypothetical protein [Chloroflexota bacterium]
CGTPAFIKHTAKLISEAYPEKLGPLPPLSDEPEWFDPEEGWKAAAQVELVLDDRWTHQTVPQAVLQLMRTEVRQLLTQLERAVGQEVGFYMSLEVSANPPDAVFDWWQADLAETAEIMRKCLEEHEKNHQP